MKKKMVDPYVRLNEEKKVRSNFGIYAIIGGVILFVVILVVIIMIPIREHRKFWTFMKNVSEDTTYSSRNDCAVCTLDGETYKLDTEEVYEVYQILIYREDNDYFSDPGPVQDGIHIDYGNGSTIDMWEYIYYEKDGTERTRGLAVYYVNLGDKAYGYTTENLRYSSFLEAVKK